MKRTDKAIIISIIIILIITVLILLINNSPLKQIINKIDKSEQIPDNQLIGGQRDEHGCLGPAGYTYDEDIQACIRTWELDDIQKQVAKKAVEDLGPSHSLTISKVESSECPDCFFVYLTNKEFEEIKIEISEGDIIDKSFTGSVIYTPDQCTEAGGRIVNLLNEDGCKEGETKLCDVPDQGNPCICCVEK